jgi:sporulation protein YqfC
MIVLNFLLKACKFGPRHIFALIRLQLESIRGGVKMVKSKDIISRAMADLLEIPKDLVLDMPKITMIGRNELYLENHRGIIEYSSQRLRINLSRGFLEILGSKLEIKALLPEEMKIEGDISSCRFVD